MNGMRQLIRTTLVGGIIFLIPLVFVVAVFGKAVQIMKSVAVPIGDLIPIESVAGVAIVPILTTSTNLPLKLIARLTDLWRSTCLGLLIPKQAL